MKTQLAMGGAFCALLTAVAATLRVFLRKMEKEEQRRYEALDFWDAPGVWST